MVPVFETNSYDAVREAEQIKKDKLSDKATDQIEPISNRNKKKGKYLKCAAVQGA